MLHWKGTVGIVVFQVIDEKGHSTILKMNGTKTEDNTEQRD